jgi:pimeloyl-ACP methyl ester carboxylesterase
MKRILLLWFCLPLVLSYDIALPAKKFVPTFRKSRKPVVKIPKGQEYTFGYLEVLENRDRPEGPTIKLPVYIFKSRNPQPKPDPILYTVGGPGASTMPSAPYMKYYSFLDDRDFILFEQRGTAFAQPHLDCPQWDEAFRASLNPSLDQQEIDALFSEAAAACKMALESQGIDLNAYRTTASAADIEDLRIALGIEQWNLLSISYSTKIAQVLMRDYPAGIRSVVMDSPLPLEVNYDTESVQNLLDAYERLFADCAADSLCRQSHPDLQSRFFSYLEDKSQNPLALTVPHPQTQEELNFRLRGKDIVSLIDVSSHAEIPQIPQIIEDLLMGKNDLLETRIKGLFNSQSDGQGMRLSVWCAEETPFVSETAVQQAQKQHPAVQGLSPMVFDHQTCAVWGVEPEPERENQAVASAIPTLILNGEFDANTPPKWGKQMLENLSQSHQVIFPGWGHTPFTNWSDPCAMELARAFFNEPGEKPFQPCLDELQKVSAPFSH